MNALEQLLQSIHLPLGLETEVTQLGVNKLRQAAQRTQVAEGVRCSCGLAALARSSCRGLPKAGLGAGRQARAGAGDGGGVGTFGCFLLLMFEPDLPSWRRWEGGEQGPFSTQGKLDQTAQEISAIFQHRGRLVGQ